MKVTSRKNRRRKAKNAALMQAVRRAESQEAFGRAIGRSQSTVWDWLYVTGKPDPADCHKIAAAFGVPVHLLRPDVFPDPSATASHAAEQGRVAA